MKNKEQTKLMTKGTGPVYWPGTPDDLKMTPSELPKNYINFVYDPESNKLEVQVGPTANPELLEASNDLIAKQAGEKLPKVVKEIIKNGQEKTLKITGRMPLIVALVIETEIANITKALLISDPTVNDSKIGYIVTVSRGCGFKIATIIPHKTVMSYQKIGFKAPSF